MAAMRPTVLLLALGLLPACDSAPKKAKTEPTKDAEAKSAPATPTPKPKKEETKAAPMAPAPEGTVVIDGLYVHTCAAKDSCPTLLQDAGAAHCKGLALGGMKWRLPRLEELERWVGNDALQGYDVFHWSGSAWDEDPAQWWIFDPGSKSKTTAKPDRKPFTIRCASDPSAAAAK